MRWKGRTCKRQPLASSISGQPAWGLTSYYPCRAPRGMGGTPGPWSTSRNQPTATSAISCSWASASKACAALVSKFPSNLFPPGTILLCAWLVDPLQRKCWYFCFPAWGTTHIVPTEGIKRGLHVLFLPYPSPTDRSWTIYYCRLFMSHWPPRRNY